NAHGLGLFYPPRSTTAIGSAYIAYIENRLFDVTRESHWTSFLARGLPPQLSGDPPPMPDDVLIPPFTRSSTWTTTITPNSGGRLTISGGDFPIELRFPANAVTSTTTVSYTSLLVPLQSLPSGRIGLHSFILEAGTSTGQVI